MVLDASKMTDGAPTCAIAFEAHFASGTKGGSTGIAATAVYPRRIDDHNIAVISLASAIPEAPMVPAEDMSPNALRRLLRHPVSNMAQDDLRCAACPPRIAVQVTYGLCRSPIVTISSYCCCRLAQAPWRSVRRYLS